MLWSTSQPKDKKILFDREYKKRIRRSVKSNKRKSKPVTITRFVKVNGKYRYHQIKQ